MSTGFDAKVPSAPHRRYGLPAIGVPDAETLGAGERLHVLVVSESRKRDR
jgi:hypothetical protein